MRVTFANAHLERCYLNSSLAVREWGSHVAARYIGRVDLVADAKTLRDVALVRSVRLHPLKGDRRGQYALALTDRWRLVIVLLDDDSVRVEEVTNHYDD